MYWHVETKLGLRMLSQLYHLGCGSAGVLRTMLLNVESIVFPFFAEFYVKRVIPNGYPISTAISQPRVAKNNPSLSCFCLVIHPLENVMAP